MTRVSIFSFLPIYEGAVKELAKELGKTYQIHDNREGVIEFTLKPDLIGQDIITVQKMTDAIGYGKLNVK